MQVKCCAVSGTAYLTTGGLTCVAVCRRVRDHTQCRNSAVTAYNDHYQLQHAPQQKDAEMLPARNRLVYCFLGIAFVNKAMNGVCQNIFIYGIPNLLVCAKASCAALQDQKVRSADTG